MDGNGRNGGLWGTDWFGRARAAVVYILVNDYHEAVYLIRGTDAKGALLDAEFLHARASKDTIIDYRPVTGPRSPTRWSNV
jgi:hypothetical protein